jgi:hypothetical protein
VEQGHTGANILTAGLYGTGKEYYEIARDYNAGKLTNQDVEDRLIHAAGGAVLNAAMTAATSKAVGEGFRGKGTVVEHFTQMPKQAMGLARSAGKAVVAAGERIAVAVGRAAEGVGQLGGAAQRTAGRFMGLAERGFERLHDAYVKSDLTTLGKFEPELTRPRPSTPRETVPPKGAGEAVQLEAARTVMGDAPRGKTVAGQGGGNRALSGWTDAPGFNIQATDDVMRTSERIGHRLQRAGAFDRGEPGRYFASHAEKQLAVSSPEPIAVSSPMCHNCYDFMRKLAIDEGRVIPVEDPVFTRWFYPSGKVRTVYRPRR